MESRSVLSETIDRCELLSDNIIEDINKVIQKSNELRAELRWIKSLVLDNDEKKVVKNPTEAEMSHQLDVLNDESSGYIIPGVQVDQLDVACPIAESSQKGSSCDQEPAGASLLEETVFKSMDLREKNAEIVDDDEPESVYRKMWKSRIEEEKVAYHTELGKKSIKNITVSGKV